MTKINLTHLSKVMAHALRHQPFLYELELDEEGWTPVENLLAALQQHRDDWQALGVADLQAAIESSDKRRYEIQGDKIRALYGHSTTSKIRKRPAQPPPTLYHGTSNIAVKEILKLGLKPMRRQYVHLSTDTQTASEVGQRKKGQMVLLVVEADSAHRNGVQFYEGNEKVWLADFVPPEYIKIMDE